MRQAKRAKKKLGVLVAVTALFYDNSQTDLNCSCAIHKRQFSLFGLCTPVCPDEKEFGQKLLKDNLSQKVSSALQHF